MNGINNLLNFFLNLNVLTDEQQLDVLSTILVIKVPQKKCHLTFKLKDEIEKYLLQLKK